MLVTPFGIVADVKPEHNMKAYIPILFTELGMVTDVILSQPLKAKSPILVTPSGITKSLTSFPLIYKCLA